jgi:hypothetical protein
VNSVIAMGTATSESAAEIFADVRRQMVVALGNYQHFAQEPARKRVYCRCMMQVGRLRGTWWSRLVCAVHAAMAF